MSPVQRAQALSGVVEELRSHPAVADVKMRHDPHTGLGPGNEVLSLDTLVVKLHPNGRRDGAQAAVVNLFWGRTLSLGLPTNSVLLEVDGEARPYLDPPL